MFSSHSTRLSWHSHHCHDCLLFSLFNLLTQHSDPSNISRLYEYFIKSTFNPKSILLSTNTPDPFAPNFELVNIFLPKTAITREFLNEIRVIVLIRTTIILYNIYYRFWNAIFAINIKQNGQLL